ncbi:MAG: hypothetical protein IPM51_05820 [Sphingobacteriaceae bacterium]|nr:hypothetical protein [Sphingobacteriaceae bacterium]
MDVIRIKFHQEILDLRNLILFYEAEFKLHDTFMDTPTTKEELLILELSETLKKFKLSKLQYNYNSIIISLYGSFERFIENCLITYVDNLNNLVNSYKNLPESILKNHFTLSLSLLNKIEQPKYGGPLTKEDVIKNLHTCININEGYQLNKDAFAQHTANFRLQVVEESFSHIGINQISQKVLKVESFINYSNTKLGLSESSELIPNESFQILNDLAEYRNYVAHGITSEIIKNDILIDYLDFFEAYSSALIEVLRKDLLYRELEATGIELGEITDVFKDGKVVCFKTNNQIINKGDVLIGKNKERISKATITKIKLNDKEFDSIDDKDNYEIGAEINDSFKKNYKIYLLKK